MKIYIFRSIDGVYGLTAEKLELKLPNSVGPWAYFKEIEMNIEDDPRIGVSPAEALPLIDRDGYYLTRVQLVFNEGC